MTDDKGRQGIFVRPTHIAAAMLVIALLAMLGDYFLQPFDVLSHVKNNLIHADPEDRHKLIETEVSRSTKPILDGIDRLDAKLEKLNDKIDSHLTDPAIHHPALQRLDERVNALEKKNEL